MTLLSPINAKVGVFWDYENLAVPSDFSGYEVAAKISAEARKYGAVSVFRAYMPPFTTATLRTSRVKSELQASGVTLSECPTNDRKDVADKMIIVDLLAFALDNPAPATVILVSADRDFAYPLAVLRNRNYNVVLLTPSENTHISLLSQASVTLEWTTLLRPHLPRACSPIRKSEPSLSSTEDIIFVDQLAKDPVSNSQLSPSPPPLDNASLPPDGTDDQPPESFHQNDGPQKDDVRFRTLIEVLEERRRCGQYRLLWSKITPLVLQRDRQVSQRVGVRKWREYIEIAENVGVVTLGTHGLGGEWVELRIGNT